MVANKNASSEIVVAVKSDPAVIETLKRQNEVIAIKQEVFQVGVHYGPPYKGAKNDTLLKPGATFLQQKYGYHELHERLETTIHVDRDDLSKSYIIIQDRCRIFNADGVEVAQADAACTTFEDKYLYRGGGGKKCPDCGGSVMTSKFPDKRTGDIGFYCRDCKANFVSTDERITGQDTTKSVNSNPLNLLDTIIAMAQKRASVRSTIKATGVDALFSPGDGVTVDYYDDLDQSNEQLITVVAKNAVQTQQEGRTEAQPVPSTPTSQQPPDDAQTAKSRFAGNGAPATGEKKRIGEKPDLPGWRENADEVYKAVRPLYKNADHMRNSVEKLVREGKINDKMLAGEVIPIIQNHKDDSQPPF